jgi:S-adenosyl-L-methionine hydrolase (adenosine-forming)
MRPILFLSDYGLADEYVGVCHAVIARLAPEARVIDLTHGVPAQDVAAGALALVTAIPYAPDDTVFLAVVDPGVGTERRAVAVEAAGALLVGPDNGVLALAVLALGGARRAVALEVGRGVPWPVSGTFHGRDVFAPAAARLAAGSPLEALGRAVEVEHLSDLLVGEPLVEPGRIATTVAGVDRFGNLRLGAGPAELEAAGLGGQASLAIVEGDDAVTVRRVRTFGELSRGELGAVIDSAGWLAVVCNLESAAERLGLRRGDPVVIAGTR